MALDESGESGGDGFTTTETVAVCAQLCVPAELPCDKTLDDYVDAVCKKLPSGPAWEGPGIRQFMKVWAHGLQCLDQHACQLLNEFHCSTAEFTKPIWELQFRADGMDPCVPTDWLCALANQQISFANCRDVECFAESLGIALECRPCEGIVFGKSAHFGCLTFRPTPKIVPEEPYQPIYFGPPETVDHRPTLTQTTGCKYIERGPAIEAGGCGYRFGREKCQRYTFDDAHPGASTWRIIVDVANSPGLKKCGIYFGCDCPFGSHFGPDRTKALRCLFERWMPAWLTLNFEFV